MRLTLCLHASASAPWAYLLSDDAVVARAGGPADPASGPTLEELTRDTLAAAGASMPDISRIAVDVGPGRLSAVRAAVSFGNALAFARGLPIAPILSSAAVAFQAERATGLPTLIVHKSAGGAAYVARSEAGRLRLRHGPQQETLTAAAAELRTLALAGFSPEAAMLEAEVVDGGPLEIVPETFLALIPKAEFVEGPIHPVTEQSDLIDA